MLVICEDKTATHLMSAMYQSQCATAEMRDEIVNSYVPNFSSHDCDSDVIGSMLPSNPSAEEKKQIALLGLLGRRV